MKIGGFKMRYSIFLPMCKGGYKIGEAQTVEQALFVLHESNQRYRARCVVYDTEKRTTDLRRIISSAASVCSKAERMV